MSEAARVPFTETKAPESAERLHRGALGLVDISASTMANIGPAYSFYFGFAGMVLLAGLASPLVILVAAVAIVEAEMSTRPRAPRCNRSADSGAFVSVNGTLAASLIFSLPQRG